MKVTTMPISRLSRLGFSTLSSQRSCWRGRHCGYMNMNMNMMYQNQSKSACLLSSPQRAFHSGTHSSFGQTRAHATSSNTPSTDKITNEKNNSLVKFEYDAENKVGFIILNSPSTYNSLTVEMGEQFESLIHGLSKQLNEESSSIRNLNAVILKGANHNFSSGGDLTWLRNLRHNPVHINADRMYSFYKSFLSIRSLPVPTIAHIEGYAIGAGACLAIATDLRVMDENAKIGFNFVKLGIHSGMGGSHLLSNIIGESQSKLALLTGKVFNAKESFENSIAHEISSSKKNNDSGTTNGNVDEAMNLAKKIASMHPLAIRSMVQTTRMREDSFGGVGGLDATMKREAYAQALCYAKSDWGEGLDAAIEKRQPDFSDYHDSDW